MKLSPLLKTLLIHNLAKKILLYDYRDLAKEQVDKLSQVSILPNGRGDIVERVASLEDMVSRCDIVTINCRLHESTKGSFNKKLISHLKDGSYLVNTARGAMTNKFGGGTAMTPH
ncbi:formate dehydrogenase (NAD+) [Scheffersomyces spartinae]|uniref:Formate dehydrogenase (NAD+) n=1 Tax=Scheffersomyces spartinae TaxID=45513 RepID=A0A9P7VDB9_9ASCO|nr:formate dehydrogenase (NAD+) [Scheffersomyces spartinae]KAG7196048.1 formate dehydrogenase (NAD+) [Scheffersomyces spartinae]